jgi:outer membrane protein assembly factor BamB
MVLMWLAGCKKEPPVTPEPPCYFDCNRDTLNILWVDTPSQGELFQSIPIFKDGNSIIFSYDVGENSSAIQSRNIFSGEVEWEILNTPRSLTEHETGAFYSEGKLLLNSGITHYSLNVSSAINEWSFDLEKVEVTSFALADKYITSRYYSTMGFPDSAEVLVCDVGTGICDVAFREYAKGLRGARVRGHSGYVNSEGDLILLIGIDRMEYASGYNKSSDLICFNFTQDTLIWEVLGIEQNGGSGLLNIGGYFKVEQSTHRVYVMAAKTLYCYDLQNGQEIWRSHFTNTNMLSCNYIIHGDKVVWIDDMGYSIAVNKHTGDLLYRENLKDGAPGRIEAWGNRCILGFSELQLIDLNTGKVLRKAWVPKYGSGRWFTSPLIDEANNRMYFTDGYAIICAEIPETWKE